MHLFGAIKVFIKKKRTQCTLCGMFYFYPLIVIENLFYAGEDGVGRG